MLSNLQTAPRPSISFPFLCFGVITSFHILPATYQLDNGEKRYSSTYHHPADLHLHTWATGHWFLLSQAQQGYSTTSLLTVLYPYWLEWRRNPDGCPPRPIATPCPTLQHIPSIHKLSYHTKNTYQDSTQIVWMLFLDKWHKSPTPTASSTVRTDLGAGEILYPPPQGGQV